MGKKFQIFLILIGILSLAAGGCFPAPLPGRIREDSEQIDLGSAQSVQVDILMGAGELEINGGSGSLLEAEFRYSDPDFLPDIDYRIQNNGKGLLEIEQGEKPGNQFFSGFENQWELRFNDQVPLDMVLTFGAGESNLDLEELNLRSLNMKMGAGQAYLDLVSIPDQDLDVNIQGGVGELTVILPPDVIIEAQVTGGLGEVNVVGLSRQNDRYVSDFSGSGPEIRLDIEAGIGELNLLVR